MRPQQVENYQVPTGLIIIFYELDRQNFTIIIENTNNNISPSVGLFLFTI